VLASSPFTFSAPDEAYGPTAYEETGRPYRSSVQPERSYREDAPPPMGRREGVPGPPRRGAGIEQAQRTGEETVRQTVAAMYPREIFSQAPDSRICCFNRRTKTGFVFLGRQFFEYLPHYHQSVKDVMALTSSLGLLRRKAEKLGMTLIEVPYSARDMRTHIVKSLRLAARSPADPGTVPTVGV